MSLDSAVISHPCVIYHGPNPQQLQHGWTRLALWRKRRLHTIALTGSTLPTSTTSWMGDTRLLPNSATAPAPRFGWREIYIGNPVPYISAYCVSGTLLD